MTTPAAAPPPDTRRQRAALAYTFLRLRRQGWTAARVAAEFGVNRSTVCKYTAGHRLRPRKLSDEDRADIRRLRAAGWKVARLAVRFKVSTTTVIGICKPDRPPRPPGTLTPEQVAELRALAAAGHTQTALAERFGVSQSCVCNAVTGKTWGEAGGQPVRRGQWRKLTAEQVRTVRALLAGGMTQRAVGAAVGVGQKAVGCIARGITWRWLT